ncbi:MAG: hypothetical protein AAGC92_06390 [Pseudomonadota bacterium]
MPVRLTMPLRDALRGLRSAAELSEAVLKPASDLLPAPLRDVLRQTLHQAERVGRRALSAPMPDAPSMARAVDALDGGLEPAAAGNALFPVLVFGLERALSVEDANRLMMSETVTALAAREAMERPASGRSERAASLLDALLQANAVAPAPGTGFAMDAETARRAALALFAVCLWLMAERPGATAPQAGDETRILALCIALCQAVEPQIHALLDESGTERADALHQLADMV